ncbi:MAG: 4-hydroxythreonine-4-phosphate dehydrogenase PdxA [Sulfurimonas sp.]|nr:4-hydroxythreonine-4-phosphate dehydrogenase PdxA [Sulfurimonas sp.]
MFVALVTEHIPLREVTQKVTYKFLKQFLLDLECLTSSCSRWKK